MGLFSGSGAKVDDAARRERLIELTAVAKRGLSAFVETGSALEEIQREELWRLVSPTWSEWCSSHLGLTDRRVSQLIDASKTASTLREVGIVPRSERVARELSGLKPDEQKAAWSEAIEAAGGSEPTAEQVAKAAKKRKPKGKKRVVAKPSNYRVPGAAVRVVPRKSGFVSYVEALRHALAIAEQAEQADQQASRAA